MARSFAITTTATDTLQADAEGHAQAVFTVTNSTSRPIRGLAKVKALGDTKREWLNIEGEAERDFAAGATQQFTVNFDAKPDPAAAASPATPAAATATPAAADTAAAGTASGTTATTTAASSASGVKPGKYGFRLDVASAMKSDEDFTEGPVVTVEVPALAAPVKKSFPIWIIPVIAVVLIAIGITAWLLLRTKKVDVPDVVGKPVAEATSTLETSKLKANVTEEKQTGTMAAGMVLSQDPAAGGDKVPEGSPVNLVVEAEAAATPTPVAEETATPTPSPTVAPPAPFAGRWINTDPNTGNNTRIDILQTGTQLKVHAWGKCTPKDCDWGTVDGAVVGEFGNVTWDQGFVLRKMVIRLAGGNDRILVITDSVYNDNRPRRHTEETFKRQSRLVDLREVTAVERLRAIEAIKVDEAKKAKQ